jgi:hypothetical protein
MTGLVGNQSGATTQTLQTAPLLNPMEVLTSIAEANVNGGSSGTSAGNVIISPFGELIVALIQVQMQNAEYFKQVAAQAAARLQQQAEQQANEQSKQFLTKVANDLQTASQTGDLLQMPQQSALPIQAYSKTGQPVTANIVSNIPTDPTNPSLSQVLTIVTSQVKAALSPVVTSAN